MSSIISSVAGTRTEPKDGYVFTRGTTAIFKIIFTNNDQPTTVDVGTTPQAKILAPRFISKSDTPVPQVLATLDGVQVTGQDFEYKFEWEIPSSQTPLDNYIVSYQATLAGQTFNFGDEFFTIIDGAGSVGLKDVGYATVDDIRKFKFNIDSFLPKAFASDLTKRNELLEEHIRLATDRLREELNLHKSRGFSRNYKLFVIFYTIWSILLAARGEDGSSVSDSNLNFWRSEWERILAQEKRESLWQGIPVGRG